MTAFVVTRHDGRSNAQVLIDSVRPAQPGDVFTFEQLSETLSRGTDRTYTKEAVRKAVGAAYPAILKLLQRAIASVKGVGYRVVLAEEHRALAVVRKKRSDVQLLRGLQTLREVRLEEMGESERKSHEGMLMVVGALYQNQQQMERRLRRVEDVIAGVLEKSDPAGNGVERRG